PRSRSSSFLLLVDPCLGCGGILSDLYERSCFYRVEAMATATKGAQTRAAILDRAVDLASVEGLEGLTIGRLAAELRMSKSGLFAHFGSKRELQLATIEAAGARFRTTVVEPALERPEGAARLRALVGRYL